MMRLPHTGRPAPPNAGERCARCGTPLAGRLHIGVDEGHRYCEACFLGEHRAPQALVPFAEAAGVLAEALAETLDIREHETGLHSKRVACHTLVLARRAIDDPQRLHQMYWGALLHDIGKIGVPDAILLKHGALSESEWSEMQTHPEKGYRILSQVPGMAEAAEIVYSHEERFDGSGYPRRLAGETIPFGARLFAVIDTLDAMTSDRPYRRALPFDAARAEITRMAGTQFDPFAVDLFLAEEATLRQMVALKCMTPDALIAPDANEPRKET